MESLKASSQLLLDHELQSRARREQQQRQQQQQPSPPPANDPQPQQPQPQPPLVPSAALRTQLDAYLAAAAKIADIIARFYRLLELRYRRPKKKQEATKASSSDPPSDPPSDDDSSSASTDDDNGSPPSTDDDDGSSASTEDNSSSWDLRWRIPWLVYLNKETLRLLQARPRRRTARRRRSQRRLQRQNRRRKTRMRKRKPKRKDNHDNNEQRGSGSSPRQPQLLQSDHSRAVPLARLGAASATEKRQHRRSMAAQKAALRKRQKASTDEWKRVLQRRKERERDEEKKEEKREEKTMDPTASTAATAANEVEEQSRRTHVTQSGFRLFPVIPLVPGHVILPLESVKDLYQRLTQTGGRPHKAQHSDNAHQSLFHFPAAFWNDFTYLATDAMSVSFGFSSLRVLTDDEYEQKQREEKEKKERKRKRERQRRERKRQQLDPSIPRPKRTAPAPKKDYPLPERLLRGGASASSPSPSSQQAVLHLPLPAGAGRLRPSAQGRLDDEAAGARPARARLGHQALRQPQLPRELHRPRRERVPQHAGRRRAAALLAPGVGAPRGSSRLPAQLAAARDASRRAQGEQATQATQGPARPRTPGTRTAWRRRVEQRRTATATATAHMLRLNAFLAMIAQCDHDPL